MNIHDIDDLQRYITEASKTLGCYDEELIDNLSWYSWEHLFGNSLGPHDGISLQVMTYFQVFAFKNRATGQCIKVCAGVWKERDGQLGGW
jgi:hypothetical protein